MSHRNMSSTDGFLRFRGTSKYWEDIRVAPNARTTGTNAPVFEQYI